MVKQTKRELEFHTELFMADIRITIAGDSNKGISLRDIEAVVGISAATLSRIDRGMTPDMVTFMTICQAINGDPGRYFRYITWQRIEDK